MKKMLQKYAPLALFCMLAAATFILQTSSPTVFAATSGPITGWAWSDSLGWVSLNCETGGPTDTDPSVDICSNRNYGLTLNTDGTVSGYAWSDYAGWIQFGGFDVNDFPIETPEVPAQSYTIVLDESGDGTCGANCWQVPDNWNSADNTIELWGGGGGGGSEADSPSGDGKVGGATSMTMSGSPTASGGQGGRGGYSGGGQGGLGGDASTPGNPGANTSSGAGGAGGNAPSGGTGGAGGNNAAGAAGSAPGAGGGGGDQGSGSIHGGGGGSGGYVRLTNVTLTPETSITYQIGTGGAGGTGSGAGGAGATGEIIIKYTSETIPEQPYPGTQNVNARFDGNRLIGWARALLGTKISTHTRTYTMPGTHTFKVPSGVTSLTVKLWGGGGGGGYDVYQGPDGLSGGSSTFGSLSAGGGQGGINGSVNSGAGGAGGIASGDAGATKIDGAAGGNSGSASGSGGSAPEGGGAGGSGVSTTLTLGNHGTAPGGGGSGGTGGGTPFGGGGGSGAYVLRTYSADELTAGTDIPITVGAGGLGGTGGFNGGDGADGRVEISYMANGGWDGWIYLGDTGHGDGGIADVNGVLSGYVWGSEGMGWLQFFGDVTPPCEEAYVCIDSDTQSQHTNPWCEVTTTPCAQGCNPGTGQCITGAPASGDLCASSLSPCLDRARVRSGQTATLYWDIQNATSCTVEGTNGDGGSGAGTGWNTVSQTSGVTTSAITSSTRYTLECVSTDLSTFTDSVIINIVPVFREI